MNSPTPSNAASHRIAVAGTGAVSPAGWSVAALIDAVERNAELPLVSIPRPPRSRPLIQHPLPPPAVRPAWFAHPRLRRAAPISQYTVASALEALGPEAIEAVRQRQTRLGLIVCVMNGSVVYSRRFHEEVLRDPPTASPVLFPETVYNAPASHLAAVLGADGISYTLVGDPSVFPAALGMAADWLMTNEVDQALVVGAEEPDWLTTEAWDLFSRGTVASGGAGALLLRRSDGTPGVELQTITERTPYSCQASRERAIRQVRLDLDPPQPQDPNPLLVDGRSGSRRQDASEAAAWAGWTGMVRSPKRVLGEGFAAGGAWQCVVAVEAIRQGRTDDARVSVGGLGEAAAGARFRRFAS